MFNINITRLLEADISQVFTLLADHGAYGEFKGIDEAKLLEPGKSEKNGIGALREIRSAAGVLRERIVEYEYPYKLGYLIEYSKPLPYRHDFGLITLSEKQEGTQKCTEVNWQSKGHITLPLIGKYYFDKQIERGGSRAFASILKQIDQRLS